MTTKTLEELRAAWRASRLERSDSQSAWMLEADAGRYIQALEAELARLRAASAWSTGFTANVEKQVREYYAACQWACQGDAPVWDWDAILKEIADARSRVELPPRPGEELL